MRLLERKIWGGDEGADGTDLHKIDLMVQKMRLNPWRPEMLDQFRRQAERLVDEKIEVIGAIAKELLRVRRMTGDQIEVLLSSLQPPPARWATLRRVARICVSPKRQAA